MAIKATCQCGKVINAKDEYAGRRVKCPACGQTLEVPDPGAVDEVVEEESSDVEPGQGFDINKVLQRLGLGGKIALGRFSSN